MIDQLFKDKRIDDACKKIAKGNDLWQDLKQELFVVLCEYDQSKIKEIIEKKQIMYFIVRILLNFYNSKTSTFYKKYRHIEDETLQIKAFEFNHTGARGMGKKHKKHYDEIHLKLTENSYSDELDKIELAFEQADLSWYERGIAKLYIQEKSFRKLSAKLDIPTRSLCETMKDVKRKTHDIYIKIAND